MCIRDRGKRSDLIKNIEKNLEILSNGADFGTCSPLGKKLNTVQEVGDKYGVSKNTVARLIRIDTLLPVSYTHLDVYKRQIFIYTNDRHQTF